MRPKVLLLDEVNAGLNATEVDHALHLIRAITAQGITVLIIEHLMKVVLTLCTRIVVLHHGELIATGDPKSIVKDQRVVQAYLGRRYGSAETAAPENLHG
jgi:branched-chain amino acid transport system ATP-binding protein